MSDIVALPELFTFFYVFYQLYNESIPRSGTTPHIICMKFIGYSMVILPRPWACDSEPDRETISLLWNIEKGVKIWYSFIILISICVPLQPLLLNKAPMGGLKRCRYLRVITRMLLCATCRALPQWNEICSIRPWSSRTASNLSSSLSSIQ